MNLYTPVFFVHNMFYFFLSISQKWDYCVKR